MCLLHRNSDGDFFSVVLISSSFCVVLSFVVAAIVWSILAKFYSINRHHQPFTFARNWSHTRGCCALHTVIVYFCSSIDSVVCVCVCACFFFTCSKLNIFERCYPLKSSSIFIPLFGFHFFISRQLSILIGMKFPSFAAHYTPYSSTHIYVYAQRLS